MNANAAEKVSGKNAISMNEVNSVLHAVPTFLH